MTETHVVAICGSLRDESHTRKALTHALDAAARADATTELLDLREWDLPVFDADEGEAGDALEFTRRVREADAILLGTPMYHGSYSAPLKNALDYCGFDEFENKTVGLLVVAGGNFPITALEHLRSVCRALDAWVLPHQAAIPRASAAFEGEGDDWDWTDEETAERVAVLGRDVVQYANIEPEPPCLESTENVGADD
ncbi:NADPH-dependent FMN reductase [Halorientalis brevis]|uniref:NADPH-dependent FMN reductase n=1 Tax=Halorientalis brevis TaxID=1126241 RepID=A0ABD6CFC1_9EURY|nr:NADPH-dependent FMN reductase [Halorientalis brevis]